MHDTAKRRAMQGPPKRSVRAVVFDYGNVLCLEQTLEDMKGMALVCGIPHERFSELYWKLGPPYDRGDIDGRAYWTAVVGQQELALSRDQIAMLVKLDSESIARPKELSIYRHCLELLKAAPHDLLYLDDRAENLAAAARLGINSVLFDTVEKTAARVESRFDIPVPSYGRCRQSSSEYSSTNRRPDRMESD
jgi:hypothetical protein